MIPEMEPPTLDEIQRAAERLRPFLIATPLEPSAWLSSVAGAEVLVKWESWQRTGSFKLRGALYKLLALKGRGVERVLAVSAGNHGLGVAHAAALLGMAATVVVPESAARNKVEAIARYGVELVARGADYDEAERAARALADERGVEFVSPYNDRDVVIGQATVALEMLTAPGARLERLLVPTGGGGLLAGAALAARGLGLDVEVVGVQPEGAPAMHAALAAGRIVPVVEQPTCADGLAGNLEGGAVTVAWIAACAATVVLVRERAIEEAMRGLAEREHQIVEGSGAVGVAAILDGRWSARGKRTGVMVTGRNVDLDVLRRALA